jgi:hypothetical protein
MSLRVYHFGIPSRASFIITEGLIDLGIFFNQDYDYYVYGKLIKKKFPPKLCDYDMILTCRYDKILDDFWHKVVVYDYRDDCRPIPILYKNAPLYFKRSISCGGDRKLISERVVPLNHSSLSTYFLPSQLKQYNIGCFFDINNAQLGMRRRNILTCLMRENFPNSLVGYSTDFGNNARLAVSKGKDSAFYNYLVKMHQTKIIFTAQPEPVDGDNRTWEALSSRALVFADYSYIPTPNMIEDGVHYIKYNATNEESINEAINKAKFYFANEEAGVKIANAGYKHIREYHMPVNRVRQIIDRWFRKIKMI